MTPKERAKELVELYFLLHESATDEKHKVDPKLVITTKPVMIKEGINLKMK